MQSLAIQVLLPGNNARAAHPVWANIVRTLNTLIIILDRERQQIAVIAKYTMRGVFLLSFLLSFIITNTVDVKDDIT